MKAFGCVKIIDYRLIYKTDDVFNASIYGAFLEKIGKKFFKNGRKVYYIQDNASYHKGKEIKLWFKKNDKFIEVYELPPYCLELNATEGLRQYTRGSGAHNRYFETVDEMKFTLHSIFRRIPKKPSEITQVT